MKISFARTRLTPVSNPELVQALDLFIDCHQKVLAQREEAQRIMIQKWIEREIVLMTPAYSLRDDAIGHMFNMIFTDPTLREYTLDVSFLFFTMWGIQDAPERLSMNLAEGLAVDGFDPVHSGIPGPELASMSIVSMAQLRETPKWWQRLLGRQPISLPQFLANNKPLLVVYLLYITHTSTPPELPAPAAQPATTPRTAS